MNYEEELKKYLMEECEKEMERHDQNPEEHHVANNLRNWISNFECEGRIDEDDDEKEV